jgi:hypothetical protein
MRQSQALAAPEQIKSGALSAHGASLTSTQLTTPRAGGHVACDPRHS